MSAEENNILYFDLDFDPLSIGVKFNIFGHIKSELDVNGEVIICLLVIEKFDAAKVPEQYTSYVNELKEWLLDKNYFIIDNIEMLIMKINYILDEFHRHLLKKYVFVKPEEQLRRVITLFSNDGLVKHCMNHQLNQIGNEINSTRLEKPHYVNLGITIG